MAAIDCNGKFVKKRMIDLEEKNLGGRLLDIDIYDKDFTQISRSSLGLSERRWHNLRGCGKDLYKRRKHSIEELEEKVLEILKL
ncbi:citrate lyase holo-[acyl-carrier protein] synthase [Peptoniphilus porci]|uniref:citrate lyase holo-[acyl-carrier protein] synthase n=1 Tax=Peptoniphilus porci TaxID=2652280 RepID=A0A1U7LXJ4_9FIRM|nr:citrate lyase holo-[acyl-carrier protein] synthase [Peptoniphilus porci]OLR63365.1 hypothetical protein BIV18_00020 [Peptoniphilus porci]